MRWLVTTLLLAFAQSHTFIGVNDSAIMYTGRFDLRVENIRTFSWPGCQIDVQFWGTKVKAYLSGSYPGAGCGVVFQRLFLTPLTPQLRTQVIATLSSWTKSSTSSPLKVARRRYGWPLLDNTATPSPSLACGDGSRSPMALLVAPTP